MPGVFRELESQFKKTEILRPLRSTTSLFADDQYDGTYCCLGCRQEIGRTYVPFKKQWGLKRACACVIAENERAEKESERRYRRGQMERVFSRNIMNERLKQARLSNFIERSGSESSLKGAKEFVEGFESRETGLLLFGPPGNGKSHLAAGIHHELNHQGFVCLFLDVPQLLKLAETATRFDSKINLTDIINGAVSADLLTLDELGAGDITSKIYTDILFPIINGRQGKITNYTSNLNLERLENWLLYDKYKNIVDEEGRLFDRILGSSDIYHNTATSKRREDAIKRMQG
nr:ATP-binding protein [Paenibacillus sp. 79R4]